MFTNQAFRTPDIFEQPKVIVRQIPGKRIIATYDESNIYTDQTTYIINHPEKDTNELKYLTGILASKLMYYYFSNTMGDNKDLFPKIKRSNLLLLPIPKSNLPFIEKVNQILTLKQVDSQTDTSVLEAEIDKMVYELYDLTAAEVLIVEGKS